MTYDYIITGAGPAGCVLANRLSEDPDVRVLLLEAGGGDWNPLFHMPAGFAKMTKGVASWGWHTVPQKHMKGRVLRYTQAKVIGGGSSINAQLYTRGNAADYDLWASEEGCAGWDYRSVLPYFKRAEDNQRFADDYHSYGGPLGVSMPVSALPICDAYIRAGQELGIPYNHDFNGKQQAGVGFYQLTQRNAAGLRLARLSLADQGSPESDGAHRCPRRAHRARGQARRRGGSRDEEGRRDIRADRRVLVSSGAIGSPKLLLQSGIGPADHLRSVRRRGQARSRRCGRQSPGSSGSLRHLRMHRRSHLRRRRQAARTLWAGLQYVLFRSARLPSSLFETGGFWYARSNARSAGHPVPSRPRFGHRGRASPGSRMPGVTLNSAYLHPALARHRPALLGRTRRPAPLIDPNYWEESARSADVARSLKDRAGNHASSLR
ncbi:alanine-phosphoribitol ligase [Sinorhizobium meliloti]|nr:alanine-phosphoribitol ligase [Sinorhizobium meliloti]